MRPEHWLFTIPLRLRSLFRWAQADQELDDELRDHLDRKTEEYVARGMTQEEAHRRARLDLGGIEQTKEKCRDARRVNWIQDFVQDLRLGARTLRKSPGFTIVAVLTLALGIGANTAIFSVLNAVLLRPLPGIADPSRLVAFYRSQKADAFDTMGYPDYADYRDRNQSLSGLAAHSPAALSFSYATAERVRGDAVSGNYFEVLGVKPALGRLLLPEDDSGSRAVAVLSYGLWQRK